MFQSYTIIFFIYCRLQRNDHTRFQFCFIIGCYPGTFMISSSNAMAAMMRIVTDIFPHQVVYLTGPYTWFYCLNADFQSLLYADKYFLLPCPSGAYDHCVT